MSNIIARSFKINLSIMKLCHLYPPEQKTAFFTFRAYLLQLLFVIPIPVSAVMYLITETDLNMERVNYNAGFLAQATCFIAKFFAFIQNGDRLKKCIAYFESCCISLPNQYQKCVVEDCIKVCRRNTFIFIFCVAGGSISWATKPFFWSDRSLPVDLWLPFNPYENWFLYICIYVFLIIAILFSSFSTAVIDPFMAGLAYHATSQVKILKYNLEHLQDIGISAKTHVKSSPQMINNILLYERIRLCVVHHNAILKFAKEFEACFSPVIFSQFAASVFVICFCCLQLSKIESLDYYFLQLAMYFSVILAQIYFYCYYGSTLFEESDNLPNSVYMGKWYGYDMKTKRTLITLMERSQEPIRITTGKILDLSLVTFATILRRSYSLLAVLKNY